MKSTRMTLAIVATAMIAVAATAVPASAWTYHNRYYACTLDGGFSTSATAWNTLSANASCTIAGDNNGPVTSSVELPRTVSGTLSLSGGTSVDGCAGAPANAGTLSLSGDLLLSDGEKFLVKDRKSVV